MPRLGSREHRAHNEHSYPAVTTSRGKPALSLGNWSTAVASPGPCGLGGMAAAASRVESSRREEVSTSGLLVIKNTSLIVIIGWLLVVGTAAPSAPPPKPTRPLANAKIVDCLCHSRHVDVAVAEPRASRHKAQGTRSFCRSLCQLCLGLGWSHFINTSSASASHFFPSGPTRAPLPRRPRHLQFQPSSSILPSCLLITFVSTSRLWLPRPPNIALLKIIPPFS